MTSVDGYVADERGAFDWAEPDAEVHTFVNDLCRSIGTYLYGRRMYDVMVYWETEPAAGAPPYAEDFAQMWRAADKVVFSRTLSQASTARTRITADYDPDSVRQLKATSDHDIAIAGPDLASQAMAAGLVDEVQLVIAPVTVGGGTKCFPLSGQTNLDLHDVRRFTSGMVYLRYGVSD